MGSTSTKPIIIVQGGQWGSEAKGLITHKLTMAKKVDTAIRTGTVNAGHTVYYNGKAYAMQQLPVSWVRPECKLVLGPGAYIHPETLAREVEWIADATGKNVREVLTRIWIDYRCGLHLPAHTEAARKADRHHSIGTTGKGCSEAVVGKISGRDLQHPPTFLEWASTKGGFWADIRNHCIVDTVRLCNCLYDNGNQLLVEGTQGTLLDLHLGLYPYTTHKQTQAANWLAEAGLSCTLPTDLWLVLRTYPIRVAGNSGYLPEEVSWLYMARMINQYHPMVSDYSLAMWSAALSSARAEHWPDCPTSDPALWTQTARANNREAASELHRAAFNSLTTKVQDDLSRLFEFTTVTKKLRRIGDWHWPTFDETIMMNRPHHIALTFMNYRYPNLWGAEASEVRKFASTFTDSWYCRIKESAPIGIVSFGPQITQTHLAEEVGL